MIKLLDHVLLPAGTHTGADGDLHRAPDVEDRGGQALRAAAFLLLVLLQPEHVRQVAPYFLEHLEENDAAASLSSGEMYGLSVSILFNSSSRTAFTMSSIVVLLTGGGPGNCAQICALFVPSLAHSGQPEGIAGAEFQRVNTGGDLGDPW